MPRLFVDPEKLTGAVATLDADAHRHLIKVLRLKPGDAIALFDGQGTEVAARIAAIGKHSVDVALGDRRPVALPSVSITLFQALPRGDRMDLIVQKVTELGVARIVPVIAGRTIARPPGDRRQRWLTIAREAARQSGRGDVPTIDEPRTVDVALLESHAEKKLVLWEGEHQRPLRGTLTGTERAVDVLVGPEGGFAAEEVARTQAAGFLPVGLGQRILRVETAAIVAVALVAFATGELD